MKIWLRVFFVRLVFDLALCAFIAWIFTQSAEWNSYDFFSALAVCYIVILVARLVVSLRRIAIFALAQWLYRTYDLNITLQQMRAANFPKEGILAHDFESYALEALAKENTPQSAVKSISETRGRIFGVSSQSLVIGMLSSFALDRAILEYLK